eukprot:749017-Hanusia_phi.AAC.3
MLNEEGIIARHDFLRRLHRTQTSKSVRCSRRRWQVRRQGDTELRLMCIRVATSESNKFGHKNSRAGLESTAILLIADQ